MDKNIEKMQESIEMIAKTTAHILDNMVTKEEFRKIIREEVGLIVKEMLLEIRLEIKSFRLTFTS